MTKKVTLDTGALICVIDKKPGWEDVEKIMSWHSEGKIQLFVSNRIFEPDTKGMHEDQVAGLEQLLHKYKVKRWGSVYRTGFSSLSGADLLSGAAIRRSIDEMNQFRMIVGPDPTSLRKEQVGSKLSNMIGDYDSLIDHYADRRDVFVTLDTKHYLHKNKREAYQVKLELLIQSPTEFVANSSWSGA
jgi:hypothetical protein